MVLHSICGGRHIAQNASFDMMLLYMYVSEWYSFNPHIVNILDCSTENNILELHVWLSKPMLASKQVQLRLTGMWSFVLHTNAVVSGELVKKNVQTLNEERLSWIRLTRKTRLIVTSHQCLYQNLFTFKRRLHYYNSLKSVVFIFYLSEISSQDGTL